MPMLDMHGACLHPAPPGAIDGEARPFPFGPSTVHPLCVVLLSRPRPAPLHLLLVKSCDEVVLKNP